MAQIVAAEPLTVESSGLARRPVRLDHTGRITTRLASVVKISP